jgi:hypothetical protein
MSPLHVDSRRLSNVSNAQIPAIRRELAEQVNSTLSGSSQWPSSDRKGRKSCRCARRCLYPDRSPARGPSSGGRLYAPCSPLEGLGCVDDVLRSDPRHGLRRCSPSNSWPELESHGARSSIRDLGFTSALLECSIHDSLCVVEPGSHVKRNRQLTGTSPGGRC